MKLAGLIVLAAAVVVCPSIASAQFDFKNARIQFSDQAVGKAIEKGTEFLLSRQMADGSWSAPLFWGREFGTRNDNHNCKIGATAIVLYALMEKGLTFQNEKIAKGLKWLADNPDSDEGKFTTYAISFRCQAWLRAWKQARDSDKAAASRYRKLLEADVAKYLPDKDKQFNGGYWYYMKSSRLADPRYADPSNSQYGVLAVWAGYRANMEIPKDYWDKVLKYWMPLQKPDGGWSYESGENSTYTMTAAGIASLFVCIDALMGDKFIKCNVPTEYAPVKKGLDWYIANFRNVISQRPVGSQDGEFFYGLYGIERIGLASGYKYFGDADWYKLGSVRILNLQAQDGSWTSHWGPDIASSYAMLFLIRGQHGVIFNRLEYDGDWNNRPRALANFCRWAENIYEQEVNWQIITLKSNVGEWHDAPVLTLTGAKAPKFTDEDIVKLRTYVNQGGTLFSITECGGGAAFGKGMKDAYAKMFPKYELTAAGKDHPIFTCQYKLPGVPAFFIVSNGIRPLAIHTDADLPVSWQTYAAATARMNFEAGANVLMYVTDKHLVNRGSKVWPEEPAKSPSRTLRVARVRYAGNYDPEPLALQRLGRQMAQQHDLKLDIAMPPAGAPASGPSNSAATGLPETGLLPSELAADVKIAFLTGTGGFKLADQEKQALKKWVDDGGLLVMDAAGASRGFADSAKDLIAELWGADVLLPLPLDSPVYQLKDMKIDKVKYRRATLTRIGGITEPRLLSVLAGDRPKVIVSAEDLTAGLVGYSSWGEDGYMPQSAFEIARNIAIYASVEKPASGPAARP
ncbi:MAG: DUF4159 domain-containing protein [Planctomycetes bacterium]|nr:DUF4159 domain-containing protein [Planctomycetota bacterium]